MTVFWFSKKLESSRPQCPFPTLWRKKAKQSKNANVTDRRKLEPDSKLAREVSMTCSGSSLTRATQV